MINYFMHGHSAPKKFKTALNYIMESLIDFDFAAIHSK